jgi:hypothetical protein
MDMNWDPTTREQRRLLERNGASFPVLFMRPNGRRMQAVCFDTSLFGFGIAADADLEPGEVIMLEFTDESTPKRCAARVVHSSGVRHGLQRVAEL